MKRVASWIAAVAVAAGFACRSGGDSAPPRVTPPESTPAIAAPAVDGRAAAPPPIDAAAIDAIPVDAAPLATIVDWPIVWTAERERLMLAYRRQHSDPAATDIVIAPRLIVLHYTAGNSAKHTHAYFERTRLEAARAALRKGGEVNVAAHFLVDRDGTIYRLLPETRMGRHAIGVNHVAIGVENVGDDDRWPLTDAQIAANVALVRDLASRHPIELVVGHHEVRALEGTPWFVERVRGYRNAKGDPGARFMAAVRAQLGDSPVAAPPPPRR